MKKSILLFAGALALIACGPSKQELDAEAQQSNSTRISNGNGPYSVHKETIDSIEYIIVTHGYSVAIIKHK